MSDIEKTETASPETPTEAATWDQLGLGEQSLKIIEEQGYKVPSPIQSQSIPVALEGKDLICSSQTGSGKTASFVLPMIERFRGRGGTFGLILGPTREIVLQIQQTLELFATPQGITSISLIGGVDMRHDAKALDTYPNIICATPGRLGDHLDRGNVWLDYIEMCVLDEADRMLDMGFSDQLNRIMDDVPNNRQTLLYSATIPPGVENLARKIQHNPVRVTIGKPLSAAKSVEQRLLWTTEDDKRSNLRRLLRDEPGTIIVFTRSKDGATRVWRSLHSAGIYDATYIHSDRLQAHREQALAEFKSGKYRILIATDVAGRGIHVENVAHVVNYDLPFEPEDYVHRIGRTGRAAATGRSTTFATSRDRSIISRIEKLIGSPIEALNAPFADGEGGSSEGHGRGGRGGRESGRGGRGGGGRGEPRREHAPAPAQAPRAPQPSSIGTPGARSIAPRDPNAPPYVAPPREQRPQPPRNSAPISAADFMARAAGAPDSPASSPGHYEPVERDDEKGGAPGTPEGGTAENGDAPKRRRRRRGGKGRNKPPTPTSTT